MAPNKVIFLSLILCISLSCLFAVEHDHHHHDKEDIGKHPHDHSDQIQGEHHHHHSHHSHDDHHHDDEHEPVPPHLDEKPVSSSSSCASSNSLNSWQELFIPSEKREAFWHGILSTICIGCLPILCIKCVSTKDWFLKTLLSFASGGLMGDVFLHLLPAALSIYDQHNDTHHDHHHHESGDSHSSHSHSHNAGHTLLGLQILGGFVIFFILEKIFHEFGHAHSHDHDNRNGHSHDNQNNDNDDEEARKNAVTILSIFADFSHNFTDGLTIAASFLFSYKMGLIQSFSILLHEIPHEIGDYAILIENGVSIKMAMFIQFLTAFGCLLGTILGFFVESNTDVGTKWIIPVTAGGFLYISCVQVLPILVEKKYGVGQSCLHIMGFIIGILLMIFVSFVEQNAEHFL